MCNNETVALSLVNKESCPAGIGEEPNSSIYNQ